jgi:hypothetical protein
MPSSATTCNDTAVFDRYLWIS